MKKIVYLPLDERPCNYDFPYLLADGSETIMVVRPPINSMGKKKTPADCQALSDFLICECRDADYLVLALDTLLYGGIIPSRLHCLEIDIISARLKVVEEIKKVNPHIHVSAFSLVMRCPCYSDDSEEPDYYALCGREIFLYGQNEHKLRLGEITPEEYSKNREALAVCLPYIEDYERRRGVNLEFLTLALGMVGKHIDEFTILQDDSNARGYTAMDRERILATVREKGISLDTYPGADEGGLALLSRAATYLEGVRPKIFVTFPRDSARDVVPIYEDREISKTISAQIKSSGGVECDSEDEADIILFCNLFDERTYDVYLSQAKQSDVSYIESFTSRITDVMKSGRGVAIADVAYCNAGDVDFVRSLYEKCNLLQLWGYAGWNTASNTLGTAICQSVLRYLYGDTPTNRRFTAYRILDDVVYSAHVRPQMIALTQGEKDMTVYCEDIERRIGKRTRELFPKIAERYEIDGLYMPWHRLFEIGFTIKEI